MAALETVTPVTIAGFPGIYAAAEERRFPTPLLFLHGSFSTHLHFEGYLRQFAAAGFDGYAVSLRGRLGVPPERAAGVRFQDYLEDVFRVLDDLGAAPVLVGHSLGALLALKVAEAGRCRAAVLLNPAPPGMLTAQPRALPFFAPLLPAILRGRPFKPTERIFRELAFHGVADRLRAERLPTMVEESGLVFQEMMGGAIRVERTRIRCPVLCVWGARDRIIGRRLARLTARRTGAELREYPGHGHWIMEEPGWEAVAKDIVAWLEATVQ